MQRECPQRVRQMGKDDRKLAEHGLGAALPNCRSFKQRRKASVIATDCMNLYEEIYAAVEASAVRQYVK